MEMKNKVLGGALLVAGTTIGAGMLALPVVTGTAGFVPTLCLFVAYWMFMTYTAFLLLEVNLWLGDEINLISMARKTLGKWGEVVSWGVYLFLLYLLTTAYLAGGGPIVTDVLTMATGLVIPSWVGAIPLLLIFGFFVYEGTKYVDLVNRILMLGLVITYSMMVLLMVPHVDRGLLGFAAWSKTLSAVSVVATSFGFHIIIPTLTTYLNHDKKKLVKAIFIGSLIALIVYIIWEVITLGVVPINEIITGYNDGTNGVDLLSNQLDHPIISPIADVFSLFAIITSFLGVTLSLTDFLADGLRIKKTHIGRIALFALTFIPPFVFILTYPNAFLRALEFAGAFGVIVLLALMPALMVWSGRYRKKLTGPLTVPGGKPALVLVIMISLVIIGLETFNKLGG